MNGGIICCDRRLGRGDDFERTSYPENHIEEHTHP